MVGLKFEDLKLMYVSRNPLCGNLGYLYNKSRSNLNDVLCNKWSCPVCRPIMKFKLYLEILKNVYCFGLDKHFVITSGGRSWRDRVGYEKSYKLVSDGWVKLRKVIERRYGGIDYIRFTRSHKDGYCHLHILLNKRISWYFLNEKRKKYDLGYVSIQRNRNVAEYLSVDYWKDHEWYIPKGRRHVSCSRSIRLNDYVKESCVYWDHEYKLDDIEWCIQTLYDPCYEVFEYRYRRFVEENLII